MFPPASNLIVSRDRLLIWPLLCCWLLMCIKVKFMLSALYVIRITDSMSHLARRVTFGVVYVYCIASLILVRRPCEMGQKVSRPELLLFYELNWTESLWACLSCSCLTSFVWGLLVFFDKRQNKVQLFLRLLLLDLYSIWTSKRV
jgi:hypothetical protein